MRWADRPDAAGRGRAQLAVDVVGFGLAVTLSAFVLFWPSPPGDVPFPYADKVVHALVFLAVAWTGRRVGISVRALAIGLVLYAIGSELFQHLVLSERSGDWTDVVADLIGAAAGLVIARPRRSTTRAR
jgi:VanZ family protein